MFDGTSTKNVTVDAGFAGSITIVQINAGYSGTITLARSLTVTSTFTQSAGTFTASNQTMSVAGAFTLNSGATFTASSGTLTLSSNVTINSAATFNNNSGVITFAGTTSATWACGSKTFNTVNITRTATSNTTVTINSDCSLPLGNNPTITLNTSNTGTFNMNGTLSGTGTITFSTNTQPAFTSTSALSGFTGLVAPGITSITGMTANFSSYTTFNLTSSLAMALSTGASITLPAPTGTGINIGALTVNTGTTFTASPGNINLSGSVTINSGATFNHNNGSITANGASNVTWACGSKTFNSVNISRTATSNSTMTVNSDCNLPLGTNPTVTVNSTNGTGTFNMNGTLSGTGTITFSTNTQPAFTSTSVLSGFNGLVAPGITSISGMTANFSSYTTFNLTNSITMTLSSGANLTLPAPTGTGINISTLTVNAGTTFTSSPGNVNISFSLTIDPSATFNHNNGTITFVGNSTVTWACGNKTFNSVVINRTASTSHSVNIGSDCNLPLGNNPSLIMGTSGTLNLNGTLSGTGTLTVDTRITSFNLSSTANFNGFNGLVAIGFTSITGMTANFSSYTTFNLTGEVMTLSSGASITLPAPTGTGINIGTLVVNTGTTFTSSPGNINLTGAVTINSGATFNHNNGTITATGTGTVVWACGNKTFNSVTFSRTGASNVTIGSDCNIPIGNNPTLTVGTTSGSLTLNGTLSGSGTLTINSVTTTFNLSATAVLNGFTGLVAPGLSSITGLNLDFSSYTTFNLTGSSALTLNSGATLKFPQGTGTGINTGTFTVNTGTTFIGTTGDMKTGSLVVNTGGSFTAPSGKLTIAGNVTISSTATFSHNNGSIEVTGANAYSCGNAVFNLFTISTTGDRNHTTINSDCNLPLGNNPTVMISDNGFNGTSNLNINGTLTGTGTLTFSGLTNPIFNAGSNVSGFSSYVAPSFSLQGANLNLSSASNISVTNATSIASGSITMPSNANLDFLTISGGTFTAGSGTTSVNSTFTISGTPTFNANGGIFNFAGSTATLSCNNVTFNQVSFTGQTGSKTVSSNCALPLGSNPTIPNGIVLNGSLTGSGTITHTTGTLTLNAGSSITGFSSITGTSNAMTVAGATADFSSFASVGLGGAFTLSSGTFTGPTAGDMSVGGLFTLTTGTFTAPGGNLDVVGNFAHTGGTFNHNNGTVRLTGNSQTITGTTTFYNLSKEILTANSYILTLPVTVTQTVLNTLTLKGNSTTNRLSLRSSSTGTQYRIDPQGTRDMLYIDARDGNNVNASSLQLAGTGSIDNGNNTNFGFTNTPPDNPTSLGPASVVGGNSIASYTPSFTFTIRDTANPLDTLSYRFQLSTASDFSTLVVDYSSAQLSQGSKTFTVGQAAGTGTYAVGSAGQSLTVGTYYWRVKSTDQNAAESGYTTANSGNIAFFISGAPNNPTSLGPSTYTNGGTNSNNQPTLTFNLTDADVGDTVKYHIEIDDSSDFGSLVISYTSALQAQGSASFTVGQAAGSGTYTTGTAGQTLASGSYYWRVKNIDSSTLESGFTTANSGIVAFIINAIPNLPSNLAPTNLIDGSVTTNTQPSFTFDLTDSDVADTIKFQIQIDDSSNFASPVVSYTSPLAAQGNRTFTVGQTSGGGSYADGSAGQVLGNGSYYLRIRATDNHNLVSNYLTANGGAVAFIVNGLPNSPTNLGPTNYVNGSVSIETQPTLTFDLTDSDAGDSVKYHIQIDDTANFSSVIVDYTSALQSQGSTSFTIGQVVGSGTYLTGSEGQILNTASYYWRVKTIDENGNESTYTTANGGSKAFEITQTPYVPSGLGPNYLIDGSTTTDNTPTFNFTIADPDVSEDVRYNIQISTVSDFSTTVINVTSSPISQGFKSYTASALSSGNYYWRVRTIDENGIASDFVTPNEPFVAFVVAAPPNTPTSLGPTNYVNGSVGTNTQPTLSFSLSDADVSDTLKYTIQISSVSNFSVLVVDYTSGLAAQGTRSFTVGQAEGTGTYTVGSAGQSLTSANYYWRVMSTDSTDLTSSYATARSGSIAFVVNQTPTSPTNLGPTQVVDGSTISNTQPTFTFDISDPEVSDTVKYQIQIDDSSDFSSVVVSYTSALGTQGNKSFTVGQAVGTGTYSTGSAGQALGNGNYYWRVRTTDNNNLSSSYTVANSGAVAFVIGGIPNVPSSLGPTNFVNASATLNTQPSLEFTITDPDLSDTVKYQIQISKSSSYATFVIDYTSGLESQGSKTFTVGQAAGSGTYTAGSQGEVLTSSSYYWRVRTIDQNNNISAYTSANSGSVAFKVTQIPNVPTTLGPTNLVDGSTSSDTTPTLTFTATDPDGDQVYYNIVIDDNSDFSSPVVNYTSNSATGGSKTFTVGQSAAGGTYTTGNAGQVLLSKDYYWRVKTRDINGFESAYTTANSGGVAFVISAAPDLPSNIGPASVINGTTSTSTQPSFIFTITDNDFADLLQYQFQLSSVSNFSSLLIDYVSDLEVQDAKQFIVGQPAGSGMYYTGVQGQVLTSGTYYWRVRSIDQQGVPSTYKVANGGNIAFKVTQTPSSPSSLGPTTYTQGQSSTDSTPTLTFNIADPDISDTVSYQIQIADNSSFSSIIVDYTSSLQAQGFKSFTVGQARGTGTYTRGSEGQSLAVGNFYWRVRTIDQGGITSEYSLSNLGNVAFTLATTVTPPVVIPEPEPEPQPIPEEPTVEEPTASYPQEPTPEEPESNNTDNTNNQTQPNNFVSAIIENLFPASYAGIFTPLNPLLQNISANISKVVNLDIDTTNVSIEDKGILLVTTAILSTSVLTSPTLVLYAIPFFKKAKGKTWGLIFDESTNKPIAFATVRLYDSSGKFVEQAISDLSGRYKFLSDKGSYTILVLHSEYQKKYKEVTLLGANEIGLDIAMFRSQSKVEGYKAFFARLQRVLRSNLSKINTVLFTLGFIFSVISVINNGNLFNILILAIFLFQVHRIITAQFINKGWGVAVESNTKMPVSGLIVRVYDNNGSDLKDTILTDSKGRFKFNLPKGTYSLMIVSDKYKLSDNFKSKHNIITSTEGRELIQVNTDEDYRIDLKIELMKINS